MVIKSVYTCSYILKRNLSGLYLSQRKLVVEHCDSVVISLAVPCTSQSAELHREQHAVVRTPWAAEKHPSPGRRPSGKPCIASAVDVDLHKIQRGRRNSAAKLFLEGQEFVGAFN